MQIHKFSKKIAQSMLLLSIVVGGTCTQAFSLIIPAIQQIARADSYTFGTCPIDITGDVLTIGAGTLGNNETGLMTAIPWYLTAPSISRVVISPNVHLAANSAYLFNNFTKPGVVFEGLDGLDTSNAVDLQYLFRGCVANELDVANFDTSNVTNMEALFNGCTEVSQLATGNWDVRKVTNMDTMFRKCEKLTHLPVDNWQPQLVESLRSFGIGMTALTSIDLSGVSFSNAQNLAEIFEDCANLVSVKFGNCFPAMTDLMGAFYQSTKITSVDTEAWDTSHLTTISNAFYDNSALTTLDVSNWDTSNLKEMINAFYNCSKLTTLNVSNWNTSSVTSMKYAFGGCAKINNLNVATWNTGNVQDMTGLFSGCVSLSAINVSNWNTSKVEQMNEMFNACQSLKTIDVANWNTAKVKSIQNIFTNCSTLATIDLSNWSGVSFNTFSAGGDMFAGCTGLWMIKLGKLLPTPAYASPKINIPNPVAGTPFDSEYITDDSRMWQVVGDGTPHSPNGETLTAINIPEHHAASPADYDTYVWVGFLDAKQTTAEYVVQPTYHITIPTTIGITSATEPGTGLVTLSANPKLPADEHFIRVGATSRNGNAWKLTSAGDLEGAAYTLKDGSTVLSSGSQLVFEADGEAGATDKTVEAQLTNASHKFKYAGSYQDIVTFNIQTASS